MGNVVEFRRPASEQKTALRLSMEKQDRGELQGLIQIEATEEGEKITVMGAFADRMQYGALALIKALGIIGKKIEDSDGIGYSTSESLQETLPRKKRGLHPNFLETTEMAGLEQPPRRRSR